MESKKKKTKVSPEKIARSPHARACEKKTDLFSSFFPYFYFSFCHKAPKVPSTRVSYKATYWHSDKSLNLFRQFWHDNGQKSGGTADMEQDEKDIKNMAAKDRIEKCYIRCGQAKDNLNRCAVCWERNFAAFDFNGNDAWKIFYDHVTFEEIVTPTARTLLGKPRYDLRNLDSHRKPEMLTFYPCTENIFTKPKDCPHETCPDEVNEARISRCSIISAYYKKWFQALRDNQDYLLGGLQKDHGFLDQVIVDLVHVLHTARWHMDKKEREAARRLLIDNLIPSHKEHKTGLLPHHKILVPMRELLYRLANHLSRKCKDEYLKGWNLNDKGIFEELITWAKENDLRIFNIANESEKALTQLIKKPADYANTFMAKHYHISIRTLKDSFKKSVANIHSF